MIQPPGCRVSRIIDLPSTALTKLADVRMDRAGPGFVLIGVDDKKETIRFAPLSETGELGAETTAALPARTLGPFNAAASKSAPGDQLLVVYGTPARPRPAPPTCTSSCSTPAPPPPPRPAR